MSQSYSPSEDSFLIQKHTKEFCTPESIVLDLGTGSGILAFEAASKARQVVACDINKEVIDKLKKINKTSNIKFIKSDLFSKITGKFDLIIFNPPYLPVKKIKYVDLDGGKNGTEIIERFLKDARKYLKKEGKILILTSSLNQNIEKLFKKYKYKYKLLDQEKFFFEKLFVWILE